MVLTRLFARLRSAACLQTSLPSVTSHRLAATNLCPTPTTSSGDVSATSLAMVAICSWLTRVIGKPVNQSMSLVLVEVHPMYVGEG